MIRISCTSCKAVLSVDDGFAGGVCRCQHCGTIQVVPASLKPTAKPQSPAAKPAPVATPVLTPAARAALAPAAPGRDSVTAPAATIAAPVRPPASAPANIRTPIPTAAPVVSIAGAATALPPKSAAQPKSDPAHNAHLLKLAVIIAFVLFLALIAVVFIFLREP
jgi:hypothetical protein